MVELNYQPVPHDHDQFLARARQRPGFGAAYERLAVEYAIADNHHRQEEAMSLYETDFYAWANQQAGLLRTGDLSAADLANIAEEIESMGRSEKRELLNRLAVLLMHLLKWQVQPTLRGNSWRATIKVRRRELERQLADNPSLKARLVELIETAYEDAVLLAARETGLAEAAFPPSCPWTFQEMMDDGFWPAPSA